MSTRFKPFIYALTLSFCLSACPTQEVGQSVNITIDKDLLEKVTGKIPEDQPIPEATESVPPPVEPEDEFIQTPDVDELDIDIEAEQEAMFQVVYDVANGLNNWDIVTFSNALHPNSAFAANMPLFFNQLVEAGTTHQINSIDIEEQEESSAVLFVNRYSTAFGIGQTEDLFYDLIKTGGEWKLLQIRSVDGAF